MALIRCTECKKQVSDQASTCPNCGAPVVPLALRPKPDSKPGQAFLIVGALIAFGLLMRACSAEPESYGGTSSSTAATPANSQRTGFSEESLQAWISDVRNMDADPRRREAYAKSIIQHFEDRPEAQEARDLLPELTKLADEERTKGDWAYSTQEDPMSSGRVEHARVRSSNTINLDFPYAGEQRGELLIRHHPKWGKDVIVSIQEGQILCRSYDCSVRIRFDEGAPVTYKGNPPADNSSETVFLPYSVAQKIESAARVRIELSLYQNGAQVLDFKVKGLDRSKMKAAEN